ncbi:diguanylate cyclase (GGDEF)-like protein [Rhodopseudomonas faecalis]|uniref:diguanylate cyclase n=1 Tax=Rhodopseudomonas faecalis TaxID=99655 RepID=A0A318TEH5_9BRAD|nr:GGDEF domain-containing protein [Rhodopseudomonas faecalis]PYF03301.1 diguanylate cyclase (GGDEF)-like protein [Rhodopseudomonas faecalis]TAH68536.1 MAG: GGDEF domain-containing protein [Rhodopseudomonas palustris]
MTTHPARSEAADTHAGLAATDPASDLGSDADPLLPRRLRIAQLLIGVGAVDVLAILVDWLLLGDHFGLALALRLAVVPPIVIAGLLLYRFGRNTRAAVVATALAIMGLVIVGTVIGQFASEPQSSRYVMATLFVLFGAALSASLPWRTTHWMTVSTALVVATIVVTGLNAPPHVGNLDLAVFSVVAAAGALLLRRRKDRQLAQIIDLRVRDSTHASELRRANRDLSLLSCTDPLTGAFNRRYLEGFLDRLTGSIAPYAGYGVLMIDIDRFKLLNDRCGHLYGDDCLRQIAATLQQGLRGSDDVLVRYGGEEFAVVLPEADLLETLVVGERLRAMVAEQRIAHPGLGPDCYVSVSIGAYSASLSEDLVEALRCADRALYEAKRGGRDRVAA